MNAEVKQWKKRREGKGREKKRDAIRYWVRCVKFAPGGYTERRGVVPRVCLIITCCFLTNKKECMKQAEGWGEEGKRHGDWFIDEFFTAIKQYNFCNNYYNNYL